MKKLYKLIMMLSGVALGGTLQSCVSEDPFNGSEEGTLSIHTEIRSDVIRTRAENLNENASLREKCVVYIESNKGVVRKFIGLDNLPESPISLKQGHYVAEAWTGDSVSASFSSKFYRGKEEFEIAGGDNKSLLLKCNIANVLVSVNQDALQLELSDLEVTFSHSRGSLTFNEENIPTDKGYFMMPNADKDLNYVIKGKKADGSELERTGIIKDVQRAHEYVMNITTEESENELGGGLIRITIEDIPVIEDTIDIFGCPTIMGEDFDIDEQIVGDRNAAFGSADAFTDKVIYLRAYEGFYSIELIGGQNFEDSKLSGGVDLTKMAKISQAELEQMGIEIVKTEINTDASTGVKVAQMWVRLKKSFFDNLTPKDTEYQLEIGVTDDQAQNQKKSNTKILRIATSENAIEHKAPVETAEAPDPENEPMAILAHSATLQGIVRDETITDYGIKYRKQGDSEWITVPASTSANTRAAANTRYSITLNGLLAGTTYEYKAYEANFDDCEIYTFTTEAPFVIPNASMEEWSEYSANNKVMLPGAGGERTFWDSGNHGSATMSVTLTQASEEMKHSGTMAARLQSQFVGIGGFAGKFAAGNLFAGNYAETKGTNGVIDFGREYNGSHPKALKLWANYRSGTALKGSGHADLTGDSDHAQIYVAFTAGTVRVDTSDKNTLFNPDADYVIGYGQVTWTGDFAPDGELQNVTVPISWKERAKTQKPTHIIIVCTASKFGDYFTGYEGSIMYVDDFELAYE